MRKSITVTVLAASICLLLLGIQVAAKPTHPTAGSFVNSGGVPAGSKLIMNVTYKVTNDEDSGIVGYWALSSYNKQVQVWQGPDKVTFYVVARYVGNWQTFVGALSPGAGIAQSKDGSGNFEGGYVGTFTFTNTFNPAGFKVNGNIGSIDYGGTKADVMLGTYGNGQEGAVDAIGVLGLYFPGYSSFTYINWGWTYHYRSQSWNNFDYATTGDIVF